MTGTQKRADSSEPMFHTLERIAHMNQVVDPIWQKQSRYNAWFCQRLEPVKPKSEAETVKLIEITQFCAGRLSLVQIDKKKGAQEVAERSMACENHSRPWRP